METDRQGKELFMHFNTDTYVAKRMGMYTKKEESRSEFLKVLLELL